MVVNGDATRPLAVDDARILALESDSVLGHTLKLLVLEPGAPLDADAVGERILAGLDRFPRALDRVEAGPSGPVWQRVERIDLDRHVRRRSAGTPEDLRRVVGELMSQHLDRSRPLWTVDLIGPLHDGRHAVAVRLHHAMADGIGGVRFLDAVLFDPHDVPVHPVGGRAAAPPVSRWLEWERMPGALARELGRPGARSPFDRPITRERALAFADLPLDALRAVGAARPEHATVNDVLLAVVAGGLRRWISGLPQARGHALPRLRAQIPVSLRVEGEEAAAGNRDSFLNVDLLLHESDDLRRLDGISAQTRVRKLDHDAALMDDLFRALGRAGSLARAVADNPREFGVAISNVPGPRAAVVVSGRRVERLYTSSEPAAHHALRISAISSADRMGVGFCVDPTAVADVTGLADATHDAFEALAPT